MFKYRKKHSIGIKKDYKMVFEKKMSVKDLIEQMREELRKEQEEAGIIRKPAKKAKKHVKAKKKKVKAIPLAVSGAFHSSLMKEAAEKLINNIDIFSFDLVSTPSSTNARIYPKEIFTREIEKLNRQLNRENRKKKIIEIFGDELQ